MHILNLRSNKLPTFLEWNSIESSPIMIALKSSNFGRISSNHLLDKVSTSSLLRTLSHYFEPILNGGEDNAEISSCNSREQDLISVLQPCSTMRELCQIHGLILKSGFAQYVYVVGRLISFCAVSELGSMEHAAAVFDDLEFPDGFIYNTMIRGFVRTRNKDEALRYFKRMKKLHKPVDNFTFSFILKLCADSAMVGLGRQVHCSVLKDGYELHTFVRNTLIHMYAMFRHLAHARRLFEEMPTKDLISWNVFIDGLVHCKQYNDALRTFLRMQQSGFSPDAATYVEVLSACAGMGDLGFGEMVHSKISIYVLNDFILVSNSLISMYSKCGAINKAILVFEGMKERNTVSWNSMILGLAMHGRAREALQLFDEMRLRGLDKPNGITFLGVLCACSHGGLVNEGKEHFRRMKQDYCIDPSVHHYGCMVDLLGRTGLLREAYELIRSMPSEGNVVVWRTLLGACRIHGDLEMGEVARKELMKLVPDHSGDFVLLSHLYAMVGQWDEVLSIRQDMLGMGAMKPQSGNSFFDFRHSGEIGEMVRCTPGRPQERSSYPFLANSDALKKTSSEGNAMKDLPSSWGIWRWVKLQRKVMRNPKSLDLKCTWAVKAHTCGCQQTPDVGGCNLAPSPASHGLQALHLNPSPSNDSLGRLLLWGDRPQDLKSFPNRKLLTNCAAAQLVKSLNSNKKSPSAWLINRACHRRKTVSKPALQQEVSQCLVNRACRRRILMYND